MISISIPIIFFIAVIATAHDYTPGEYDWALNTISDLAAQGLKNQWIMQAGFIGFGVLLDYFFYSKVYYDPQNFLYGCIDHGVRMSYFALGFLQHGAVH